METRTSSGSSSSSSGSEFTTAVSATTGCSESEDASACTVDTNEEKNEVMVELIVNDKVQISNGYFRKEESDGLIDGNHD